MQSSREVIDNILRNRKTDRVGVNDSIWEDTLAKWVTQGYPKNDKGLPVDQVEHFGFDMAFGGGWFDILPIRGYSEVLEENDEWKIVRNGAGASLKWWKHKSGTPEHVDFRMISREIWDRDYRSHLLQVDRQRLAIDSQREILARNKAKGKWTLFGHLFVWENMRQSMGDICLYESMLLDPDWIHDYCRVYTDFFKAHYKVMLEEVGVPDGVWVYEDLGYKGHTFCSPQTFGDMIFPYFRELVEFFHSYDLPVILHTCGLVEPLIDMIIDVGFDGLNPMEVKAGNDPLRIARKYGDRIALVGGLDARILESHDHALIRREVANLINGMKSAGARFVFASDHSISTNVDYADFQCAMEACRENMAY